MNAVKSAVSAPTPLRDVIADEEDLRFYQGGVRKSANHLSNGLVELDSLKGVVYGCIGVLIIKKCYRRLDSKRQRRK
jgi:hypothetical protein